MRGIGWYLRGWDIVPGSVVVPVFLAMFLFLFALLQILYIRWDASQIYTDGHFRSSWLFYQGVEGVGGIYFTYPPLHYVVSAVFYSIFGFSLKVARYTNLFSMLVFALSMYAIGRKMDGRTGGICTCTLAVSSPLIINSSNKYFLDFPQTAMTALAFYVLLISGRFDDKHKSCMLGIVFGMAFLTKWSALFFLIFPLLWYVVPIFLKGRKPAVLFFLIFLFGVFISWRLFMYYLNFPEVHYWDFFPYNYFIDPDRASAGVDLTKHVKSWPWYYLWNIVLPAVAVYVIIDRLEKRNRDKQDFNESGTGRMLNFCRFALVFIIIAGFWLMRNAPAIPQRINMDLCQTRIYNAFPRSALESLMYQYSFCIPLMLTGMIFILALPGRRERLILPFGLAGSVLVMFLLFRHQEMHMRNLLSYVIFTATMGGFWVGHAGRLRKPLTLFIVSLSILSLAGWLTAPLYHDHTITIKDNVIRLDRSWSWKEFFKVLRTSPPERNFYDISPAINIIEPGRIDPCQLKTVFFLKDTDVTRKGLDFHETSLFNLGVKSGKYFAFSMHYPDTFYGWLEQVSEYSSAPDIIIVSDSRKSVVECVEKVKDFFPDTEFRVYFWKRPAKTLLVLIQPVFRRQR